MIQSLWLMIVQLDAHNVLEWWGRDAANLRLIDELNNHQKCYIFVIPAL